MNKISRKTLAKIVEDKLVAGDKNVVRETAAYLLSENRADELNSLVRDIAQYRADHEGIVELTAVSAFPLSSQTESDIQAAAKRAFPSAKRVIINSRIDESQIGGVRLEMPNKQLDLSVRAKLNQFKQLTAVGDK